MDRLTAVMVRFSFGWLIAGFLIGAAMLVDRAVPGAWRAWFSPSHGHILFVGWFFQFAIGIAFWLLPRRRNPDRPLGYNERLALLAAALLNLGLALRVIAEPLERTGRESAATITVLFMSAVLQVAAAVMFVFQLWPRTSILRVRSRSRDRA